MIVQHSNIGFESWGQPEKLNYYVPDDVIN